MMTAIALLNTERTRINEVAEALASQPEISEVYSVTGNYELVAVIRVHESEALSELVTERLANVPGITGTHTMLAFRAFSRHDLEEMFAVGS